MDTQINTQMNSPVGAPQPEGSQKETKLIVSLVIIIVVLVAGYFLLKSNLGTKRGGETAGKTETIYTDLANSVTKIPAGFPSNIPVEEENVKESYKINYFDEGVTQYTIGFNSNLSFDEIWKTYSDLFLAIGYTPDMEKTSKDKGIMTGYRDGNKLNVAISDYDGGHYVTINFIQRQVSVK